VNSGDDVQFWEDVWVGDVPLKLVFPDLYEQCGRKMCRVSDCWNEDEWTMKFSRPTSAAEAEQWDSMLIMLQSMLITGGKDDVRWVLEKSGVYTTRSMYKYMSHRGGGE
jgi:hypothetical protein